MDNLFSKVEVFFEEKFKEFEKAPVKTALKLIVVLWLAKQVIKFLKSN